MEKNISILYDQLCSPRDAVYALIERRPYWLAVLVIILAVLSRTTGQLVAGPQGGFADGVAFFVLLFITQLAVTFVCLIVTVGIYHFAATHDEMLGDARVLFMLISVCLVPYIFLGPLAIVVRATPAAMPVWIAGLVLLSLWVFILKILAIKNYYGISTFKSSLIVALPYILVALVVIPLILLAIGYVVVTFKGLVS